MPTGYTADVGDGKVTDFAEFAMQCARAFGALILMRDEPGDAPVPEEFLPSDYHIKALQRAQSRVAELQAMTPDEARQQAGLAYTAELESYRRRERKRAEIRSRYEAMLDHVLAWQPPTPDHVEMKTFMVAQLEESIRFDCDFEYPRPTQQTPETWLAEELQRAERDVNYHTEEDRKEHERAAGRTQWVAALRSSLAAAGEPS